MRSRGASTIQRLRAEAGTCAVELAPGVTCEVRLLRDARARRLRLLVDDRGPRLTLPPAASMAAARNFLAEHRGWLHDQWDRLQPRARRVVVAGEAGSLLLRGSEVALRWRTARRAAVQREGDAICIQHAPAAPERAWRAALQDFYKAEAQADIGRWLPELLSGLPRPPSRFRLRPLSSLWGSLNRDGIVSLDLSLILAPSDAFRYVLVHELCHLIEANHSSRFWRAVAQRFPDYAHQRAWLGAEGPRLKAELQAAIGTREPAD